jgi:hypothetical protein
MRRTIFLALVAALLLAPAAKASDPIELLRDCVDDSVLQGNYSDSELREAQKSLPTDSDEYSDCRDVLSRALAKPKDDGADTSGGDGTGGGSTGSSSSGDGTGGDGGIADTGSAPESEPTPVATPTTPVSQQDWEAVTAAGQRGGEEMKINGKAVSPGATRLAADVGRNSLPGTLVAVLALIAAATIASVVPFLRRRGRSTPQT